MKFTKQRNLHRPEEGIWGDCLRTSIACILDLDPEAVPHWLENGVPEGGVERLINGWLLQHGLQLIRVVLGGENSLETVLNTAKFMGGDLPYLLSGFSRTGCNHVVVGQADAIVWDPSLTDAGIVGPMDDGTWWLEFIVRPPVSS